RTAACVEAEVEGADHADGDRRSPGKAQRGPDGDRRLAHAEVSGAAQAGDREGTAVDLQDGDVVLGVGADDLGRQLTTAVDDDLHRIGAVDHMEVGEDVPVAAEQHA